MKINEAWLREWVDPPQDSVAIAEILTLGGLEVDAVEPVAAALQGVVVGVVRAVEPHPDAERLALCRVDDGHGEHSVVCGAPNVRVGLKTAYAPPGAALPGGRRIERSAIRGIDSAGMLCSGAELGLGDDADGILELDAGAVPGTPLRDHLVLDDVVFDIGLTPNRGDCFCALGIARDLAVLTGTPLREHEWRATPAVDSAVLPIELLAPDACAVYAGRIIKGIDPAAVTPLWMHERLRRAGVRSIHPVVDITNYVMLELGQPMHAFDLAKLEHGIRVREATAGEPLTLLDNQTLTLDAGTLVIADRRSAVALAGVMGGAGSAVLEPTTDIFLESAWFDPIRLAGVARRYRLQTDASTRFERGVDPTMQVRAIERATALILEICGGVPGPTSRVEATAHVPAPVTIAFRPGSVERILGCAIAYERCADILRALGMAVDLGDETWQVHIPAHRSDLRLEVDLVEEVARVVGYDAIPARLPRGIALPGLPSGPSAVEQQARQVLTARGYFEAITYSFVAADKAQLFYPGVEAAALANPISSEMAVMRPSLWPGLVEAARHNLNRQADDVRLFEIGMVFADASGAPAQIQRIGALRCGSAQAAHWTSRPRDTDFFDAVRDVEALAASLGWGQLEVLPATHPALHPGQAGRVSCAGEALGMIGALHPALARRLDIDRPLFLFDLGFPRRQQIAAPQYQPISRFPAVRRDLNVVVAEDVLASACLAAAREGGDGLLRDLQLIDVYRGQGIDSGKKSLTLGLLFQVASSTLTDDEVEAAVKNVLAALRERVGGVLRN